MIPTLKALEGWSKDPNSLGYKIIIGDVEVCLEPLIFDGQWYLAVYHDMNLVAPKVCVKIGYENN